jgi:uncharacterized protein (TIGR02453 family)
VNEQAQRQFTGFPHEGFAFLADLATEQNKAWFEANKPVYEDSVRWPLMALVADLTTELTKRKLPFQGDPKRALFRIHRDVRFARDKSPYKTNAGAVLTRSGSKSTPGLLYIHMQPGRCFTAAGFYRPDPEPLKHLRDAVVANPRRYKTVLSKLASQDLHLGVDEDALKRNPRGYDTIEDPVLSDAVRRRSFIVRHTLTQQEAGSATLVDHLADFAASALPLLDFGWHALDHATA